MLWNQQSMYYRKRLQSKMALLCVLAGGCGDSSAGTDEDFGETSTMLSGSLGALGELKATASSLAIENSGEVLIYMSSTTLTCSQLMVSRWLGGVEAGAQVIELVVPSDRAVDTVAVEQGGAEVNYALGGRSSAYEKSAVAGHVTFTKGLPGPVEGTFTASFADSDDSVKGRFQAEFCAGGQGY